MRSYEDSSTLRTPNDTAYSRTYQTFSLKLPRTVQVPSTKFLSDSSAIGPGWSFDATSMQNSLQSRRRPLDTAAEGLLWKESRA